MSRAARFPLDPSPCKSMDPQKPEQQQFVEVPDNAIIVRQSQWAWLWYVLTWGIFLLVAELWWNPIPIIWIIAVVLAVPRFLRWRGTAYILTEEHVVILRGAMTGHRRFDLPIADITQVIVRPGFFGKTLGYTTIHLVVKDEGAALLQHVPYNSPLVAHIRSRIGDSGTPEETSGE